LEDLLSEQNSEWATGVLETWTLASSWKGPDVERDWKQKLRTKISHASRQGLLG
jgi:hypothetical protein